MQDPNIIRKVANIPLARPGFDALGMAAPILVKVNPTGQWASNAPENQDEKKLQQIIDYLIKTKRVSADQSYCCQCNTENQINGGHKPNNYVPIIMMPILPADQCPFDMECEIQKMQEAEAEKPKKYKYQEAVAGTAEKEKPGIGFKKRGFVMQRLNDFDLLSQW
ncbi:hypothetical protein NE865_01238 [Phthorimaea operculella]|nr:hypothetical protein NE865_01238 [Phthorimaea operculella]